MRFLTHLVLIHRINGPAMEVEPPSVGFGSGGFGSDGEAFRHLARIRSRDGSVSHKESRAGAADIPRYNHRTHEEVVEFLRFHGTSADGYFGYDKVHVPSLSSILQERIPGWFGGDPELDMRIVFGQPLYNQGRTSVYNIVDLPDKIIKYYAYCFDPVHDPIDSVVVETYFANRVALLDPSLAVAVDFYSGSVRDSYPNNKIKEPYCDPIEHENGEVEFVDPRIRYLIMPKVGLSLFHYMYISPDQRVDFIKGMKLGGQMIDLLQRLHSLNIMHGDAHISNFAFSDDTNKKLILIDFGRAELLDPKYQSSVDVGTFCTGKPWLDVYTGKWEMQSCKPSFRDDVYRAVQMIAMAIHGMPHYELLQRYILSSEIEMMKKYKEIKETAMFWEFGYLHINVARGHLQTVREHLATISQLTIEDHPEAPYTKPNYDGIKHHFKAIISTLTGTAIDDPHIFDL